MRLFNYLNWFHSCKILLLILCISSCTDFSKSKTPIDTEDIRINKTIADSAFRKIHLAQQLVHSGDLILRTGRDFTSDVVRKMSTKDLTFSHCGIASWENDTLFVYHSLGGQWNPEQTIRRDTFAFFCNPYENKGLGIFRYQFNPKEIQKVIEQTKEFYHQKIIFDMQFDLATDDKMYCTEFIYKILQKVLPKQNVIPLTKNKNISYIALDNLFLNAHCAEIKRMIFPQS